jgi:FlaG/FlaF family flagellin (archaellin)
MPLRKSGSIIGTTLASIALSAAVLPATASAGLFSSLIKPTPTATPKPTPKPTATPAPTTATTSSSTLSSAVPAPTGCTPLATTKAFQKVDGDSADYSVAPDGGFENGGTGWKYTGGAKVVSANENLGVLSGKKSLMMPLNSTATSPSFCVDETNPHFRFAYKVDNASLSGFQAFVIYRDAAGKVTGMELVSSKGISLVPTLWKASPNSPLATLLPLNSTSKTASVQLKFYALSPVDFVSDVTTAIIGENALTSAVYAIGGAATGLVGAITGSLSSLTNIGVSIDSVMVDPYRRG